LGAAGFFASSALKQKQRRASLAHRSGIRAIGQLTGSAIINVNA
jgi:hypothetical protein